MVYYSLDEVIIKLVELKMYYPFLVPRTLPKNPYLDCLIPAMKRSCFLFISVLFFTACRLPHSITAIGYSGYPVGKESRVIDSSFLTMLRPYADSVNSTMNQEIAAVELELQKELPNSPLGNFLADAYRWAAKEQLGRAADVAFMNHGGVRINRLSSGPLTVGKIHEVMPFDNLMVVMDVSGKLLQNYLDNIAASGGGGGVAGLSMRIANKKAVDVQIGDHPLDPAKTYTMVNSDYLVDGGGGFTAFKNLPQQRNGLLLRDAIIAYCRSMTAAGKKINAQPLIRIRRSG